MTPNPSEKIHEEEEVLGHPRTEANADAATVASGLPLPLTKPSEILSAAADLLETRGWTQGTYGRRQGKQVNIENLSEADCLCGIGAVMVITGRTFPNPQALAALNATAGRRRFNHFAEYNDAEGRTAQQVVATIRKSAEKAREAGQ